MSEYVDIARQRLEAINGDPTIYDPEFEKLRSELQIILDDGMEWAVDLHSSMCGSVSKYGNLARRVQRLLRIPSFVGSLIISSGAFNSNGSRTASGY